MAGRDPDDDDERDLVRAEISQLPSAPEALAHVIAQSNREAAANRAQARELIRALESVQRSQEYLGTALHAERTKSRWLVVAVLGVPVVVAAGVWFAAGRVDEVKTSMSERLDQLARDTEAARAADATKAHETRLAELASDLENVRRDLDASRDSLAAERGHLADREAALAAAEGRTDSARTEIGALEFEVKTAKAKAGAEQARAAALENRIGELDDELKRARSKAPAPAAATPPAAAPSVSSPPNPVAAPPAAPTASATPAPPPAPPDPGKAAADRAEAEKSRLLLNTLLAQSPDTVRYQFSALGGLAGRGLTGIRLVGTDQSGAAVRAIEAERAEITVDPATGSVVIRCTGGKLIVGSIEAPFFGGSYGLVIRGDAERWKRSGLDCVQ